MMAVELYRRGKTYWVAIHKHGQRVRKSLKTQSRSEAGQIVAEIERKLAADDPSLFIVAPTVREYIARRLPVWETRLRKGTLPKYRQGLAEAKRVLGPLRINEVTRAHAALLTDALVSGPKVRRSAGSIRNLLAPVQALFSDALEEGFVIANPFAKKAKLIRRVAVDEPEEVVPYTRAELERLLAVVTRQDDRVAILLGCRAGLRKSEVLGQSRPNLDMDARVVRVTERWVLREMGAPKTATSRREIPMSMDLWKAVRSLVARQNAQALRKGVKPPSLLFPAARMRSELTAVQEEGRFSRRFAAYLAAAGVEKKTRLPFHRLRHTFASELLMASESIWKVSRWLGHSSIELTNRIYAHWIPKTVEHAPFDALDAKEK